MRKCNFKNLIDWFVGSTNELEIRLKARGIENIDKEARKIRRDNKTLLIATVAIAITSIIIGLREYSLVKEMSYQLEENKSFTRDEKKSRLIELEAFVKNSNDKSISSKKLDVNLYSKNKFIEESSAKVESQITESQDSIDQRELLSATKNAEKTNGERIELPQHLKDGRKIIWKIRKNLNWIWLLVASLLSILAIRSQRFSRIRKLEKLCREDIENKLPNFVNKLVLLLSTGMIFDRAFKEAVIKRSQLEKCERGYFYSELYRIIENNDKTKEDIVEQLYEFAKRSKMRELVRIVNIVWDNMSKGDILTDKLQLESELLWFSQKKNMEERGRLSEGKLIMPLLIMLLILVFITVAPAMLDI